MNIIELRIGNYVRSKTWLGIGEIEGIEKVAHECKVEVKVNGFVHTCMEGVYFDLEPIPIDEVLLLKLGFKKDDNGTLWKGIEPDKHIDLIQTEEWFYPQLVQVGEMSHQEVSVFSANRIQYLHQLQNLYYALTGEELIIKL